ncbi:MAG: hypothetical protein RBT45_02625 [Acholeplasmataceae bacterium]|jgi:hypothetical protein|nr:hypothetical protein [Acholeplasmataceae bacterium]
MEYRSKVNFKYTLSIFITIAIILVGCTSIEDEVKNQIIETYEYYSFTNGSSCDSDSSIEYIYDYNSFQSTDIDHMHSKEFFDNYNLIYLKNIQKNTSFSFELYKLILEDGIIHIFYTMGYGGTTDVACKNLVIELPKSIDFNESIFYESEALVFSNNLSDKVITIYLLQENKVMVMLEDSTGIYLCKSEVELTNNQTIVNNVSFPNSNYAKQNIVLVYSAEDLYSFTYESERYDLVD